MDKLQNKREYQTPEISANYVCSYFTNISQSRKVKDNPTPFIALKINLKLTMCILVPSLQPHQRSTRDLSASRTSYSVAPSDVTSQQLVGKFFPNPCRAVRLFLNILHSNKKDGGLAAW